MSRQRKIKTEYAIKYVHTANGRIVYRPYIPASERDYHKTDSRGFLKPPIKLGIVGDSPEKIYSTYLIAKESLNRKQGAKQNTLRWIVEHYQQSRQYKALAPSSQKRNQNLIKILDHPLKINSQPADLGTVHISNINKPMIQKIMEARLMEYQKTGKKGASQVNKEMTFLSGAITWATNYIDIGINENPLRGLKKIKEQVSTRHVTDEEYQIQCKIASELVDWLPICFELTYLLACRGIETLQIKLSDCTANGIIVRRTKGSRDNVILWTPRLQEAYRAALALHKTRKITVQDPHLIPNLDGSALARSTLSSYLSDLKIIMKARGLEHTYWNMQLLKAKAVGDSTDKHVAGHKTEQMRQRYDRKLQQNRAVK